ncbi:MAG: hypothetical protein ACE5EC_03625 [Phycisphaerae bacterium]
MSQSIQNATDNHGNSSIYSKLSESMRNQLDRSIAERDPPTYREIYNLFQLDLKGISFSAFYRYARKIRVAVELMQTATLAFPENRGVHAILPELIATRLLEIITDPDNPPKPDAILRLTQAHRAAIRSLHALEQQWQKLGLPVQHTEQETNAPPVPGPPPLPGPPPPVEKGYSPLDSIVEEVLNPRRDS